MGDSIPQDARNKLEDLSGIVLKPGENPYAALINACNDNNVSLEEPCEELEPRGYLPPSLDTGAQRFC